MSKVVTFRPPHVKITFYDGTPELNEKNLTYEKYQALVKKNSVYEKYFIVAEPGVSTSKVDKKK